ncbi:MAG: Ig-like domain-containing protein [Alphaproteobacteria bacterium]
MTATIQTGLDSGATGVIGCGCAACQSGQADNMVGYTQSLYEAAGTAEPVLLAPGPAADPATFANYLTHGFWSDTGRGERSWSQNNVTYSLSNQFSTDQKAGLRMAFDLWADVADLDFTEVASGANISIVEGNDGRAYSSSTVFGTVIIANLISIDTNTGGGAFWSDFNDPGDYALMTALHEIGHSLGLGHTGNYNGSASYNTDAQWVNDTHQMTVMSYFNDRNVGSDHWNDTGAWQYSATPMLIDILAIQNIYGADYGTRSGNTTYGFNSNAGRDQYDFSMTHVPVAIWDGGGVDTLDLSGHSQAQTIYLTEGDFSSTGFMTHNLVIAYGAVIENAVGGSGDDSIYGNDAHNIISGGLGDDTVFGTIGDDTIDGQGGIDAVSYSYAVTEFAYNFINSVSLSVTHLALGFTDLLSNIENYIFAGISYSRTYLEENFSTPVNTDPVANDDSATGAEDTALVIDVLANDNDPDGDILSIDSVTNGANGSVVINPNGTVSYTPNANFNGSDSFTYTVDDGNGGQKTATVDVTVNPVDDAPVLTNTGGAVNEDAVLILTTAMLSMADIDTPTGSRVFTLQTPPPNGTLYLSGGALAAAATFTQQDIIDGLLTYEPDPDYNGVDSFGFDISDGTTTLTGQVFNLNIAEVTDVFTGDASDNTLNGTGGADEFHGGLGDDELQGGNGDDDYYFTGGNDTIIETGGTDVLHLPEGVGVQHISFLRYAAALNDLIVHVDDGDGDPLTSLGSVTIENQFLAPAGNQVETLRFFPNFDADLTNQRVTTFGTAGDDTVSGIAFGANPDDTILGFDGADTLDGGAGNDTLFGGSGNDHLIGGIGGDALFGNQDNDTLDGGEGDDFIFGDRDNSAGSELYTGDDILNGGGGNDWMEGNKGNDTLNGGDDNDILLGDEGDDILNGGAGDDFLSGDIGADTLNGGAGTDTLYGGAGLDTFVFQGVGILDGNLNRVVDFSQTDNDVIRLVDILEGYDPITDAIADFITLSETVSHTYISVDRDGAGTNYASAQVVRIENVTGEWSDISDMIAQGDLVVV